ncbi:hypothetical protein BD779DRAFT_1685398 [Infundibulicybe gibba]|nr:hypothetical protein BD779DRAFT_1685398 [Infundibulicybe gibba]
MLTLQPPPGFVHLVLLPHEETPFYLEISVNIIAGLCLKPRKYLRIRYLGWCVLGAIGALTDDDGEELELSGGILDQAIYHYAVPLVQDTLARAVGLEATRRPPSSREDAFPAIREADLDYATKLPARDGRCVWSNIMGIIGVPIIPHKRGDEWLRLIIANGPIDEGLDPALRTVDFENGFCASPNDRFRQIARDAAVLKTPNPILDTTDVPARRTRLVHPDLSYPLDARYTLQWLFPANPCTLSYMPNNRDATFLNHQLPRPADLLLHYNYGAAAVKNWGKNVGALDQLPRVLSPTTGRWTLRRKRCGTRTM